MVKLIVILYFILALSVAGHELSHYIVAKLLKLDIYNVTIGCKFLRIKIKNVRISPFIYKGYVEVSEESLLNSGLKGIIIFFLSGLAFNILFLLVSPFFQSIIIKYWIITINMGLLLANLVPFREGADTENLLIYCKKYCEEC